MRSERTGSELIGLSPELAVLVDQLVSLELRRERSSAKPDDQTLGGQLENRLAAFPLADQKRAEINTLRQRELTRRRLLLRQASEIRSRRLRDSAEEVSLRRQITNTPTPIGAIPVPALLVPTVWLMLAGGLLAYTAVRRRALLSILGRWIASSKRRRSPAEGLVPDAPFWLAPLPTTLRLTANEVVAADDIARFVGWNAAGKNQLLAVALGAAIGGILSAWVIWIAWMSGTYYTDPHSGFRVTAIGILTIVCCWVAAAVLWFAPIESPLMTSGAGLSRRQWIGVGLASAVGAYLLAPRTLLPTWATFNARRLRRERNVFVYPSQLASTFVLHIGSGVVHYVGGSGVHSNGMELAGKNLLKIDDQTVRLLVLDPIRASETLRQLIAEARKKERDAELFPEISRPTKEVPSPRVLPTQLAAVLEAMALDDIAGGRLEDAVKILRAGLPYDDLYRGRGGRPPSVRLYDLWGRCLLANKDRAGLRNLAEHIQKQWRTETALMKRVGHWETGIAEEKPGPRKQWTDTHEGSLGFAGLRRNRSQRATS